MVLDVPRDLGALPVSRSRALLLAWHADAGFADIAAVIETDPAMTASVLRAANSAASAPRDAVSDPRQAIVRIGVEESKKIIVASVMSSTFRSLDDSGLDLDVLWRHLVAVGLLAEELVTADEDRAAAFTAGMLHDLGRLGLASRSPARYRTVVHLAAGGQDVEAAERSQFGTTHSELGGRIGQAWHLPDHLVEAMTDHHRPGPDDLSRAVFNAREASKWIGDGVGRPPLSGEPRTDEQQGALDRLDGPQGLLASIRRFGQTIAPR